ncbi:hypothetical protein SEA_BANTAM_143 [Gordonia phage Bantam]|uniref:Uncharacterized protein n=1 Tax=Gordonia phage Bantam TaxID=1887641 RepID=A0A1B3AYM2_9CAUD|nr:hypothetical protein BIZ77_gp036 [Gordonia phage Bantam]AOE43832.1 hypothetical protein SEA_BANTAM_143 [Gordonia phage Bantam]
MARWRYHVEGVKDAIYDCPSDATPEQLADLARQIAGMIKGSRWHQDASPHSIVREVVEEMGYAVEDFEQHIGYEIDEHEIDDWLARLYDAGDWDRAWIG